MNNTLGSAVLLLLGACSVAMLTGCASTPKALDQAIPAFVVVRHAEKANDDPRDPSLSTTGLMHARALAQVLRNEPLIAAYVTGYRRTRQTAQPSAQAHGLMLTPYDIPAAGASAFTTKLRRVHRPGTVLIVGHSNTVPAIVSQLCDCVAPQLGDDDYGDLFRISADPSGSPVLKREQF